jgi:predicted deacylase
MKIVRSYQKWVNEIINMQFKLKTTIIGYVEYGQSIYPMFEFKYLSKVATKTIVITSGHHGDEVFAVHTLMKWVQKFNPDIYPEFNIYIYPICNPFGYSTSSRDNGARQDTNNDKKFFKNSNVQELAVLFDAFPVNVDLILDVHGDTGKEEVYM